jgi:hypothetical protein
MTKLVENKLVTIYKNTDSQYDLEIHSNMQGLAKELLRLYKIEEKRNKGSFIKTIMDHLFKRI